MKPPRRSPLAELKADKRLRANTAKTEMDIFTACIVKMNENLLLPNGLPKVLAAAAYKAVPHDYLKSWCHINKLFGLPTQELIKWLSEQIAPYSKEDVLEIGAGRSNIGSSLGIRQTDKFTCEHPAAKEYYERAGFPPRPLDGVEKLDALDAVDKYQPKVVIASWVSQWVDPDDHNPSPGSIIGVKKEELVESPSVELYIQVSNLRVHGHEAANRKAKVFQPKWLASRGDPRKDAIFIWRKE
jgi:hypothetical protein